MKCNHCEVEFTPEEMAECGQCDGTGFENPKATYKQPCKHCKGTNCLCPNCGKFQEK